MSRARPPRQKRGKSKQNYQTPPEFIEAVVARFGPLAYDLAADDKNHQAPAWYDERANSLVQDWTQLRGNLWLNPPFDDIAPWARKCFESLALMRARHLPVGKDWRVLLLTPASVGSNWFKQWVFGAALTLGLSPRLVFVGEEHGFPKDLMLSVFGAEPAFDLWRWSEPKPKKQEEPVKKIKAKGKPLKVDRHLNGGGEPARAVDRKPHTRPLPVVIDDKEELAKAADEFADLYTKRQATLAERRESMAEFRERLVGVDERMAELRDTLKQRTRIEPVKCVERYFPDTKVVDIVRLDTGEVVETRPAKGSDAQEELYAADGTPAPRAVPAPTDPAPPLSPESDDETDDDTIPSMPDGDDGIVPDDYAPQP